MIYQQLEDEYQLRMSLSRDGSENERKVGGGVTGLGGRVGELGVGKGLTVAVRGKARGGYWRTR